MKKFTISGRPFIVSVLLLSIVSGLNGCSKPIFPVYNPAIKENMIGSNVQIGSMSETSVGDTIYSEWNYSIKKSEIATTTQACFAKYSLLGTIDMPSGTVLGRCSMNGWSGYCAQFKATGGIGIGCFVDSANSGHFDKVYTAGEVVHAVDVNIPYVLSRNEALNGGPSSGFKYELIYEGTDGQNLRIAYREYVDNMARPAFQQELTYKLNAKGDTDLSFKGVRLTVHGADNNGIKYTVLSSFRSK